jgi:TIR domain
MDYLYDVFLSYLHEKPCGTWVTQHFLPYFQHQLGNGLARQAKIFIDRTGIHSGQKWPTQLKHALAHSTCLVGIWSPLYFQSEWCQSECAVMLHRESRLSQGTTENSAGLIVGVKVNDGIHFPKFAKETQYTDMEEYFYDEYGFTQSPIYIDFQRKIVELANDVARIVNNAPAWSPEWQSAAWLDDVIADIRVSSRPKVAQPLLS